MLEISLEEIKIMTKFNYDIFVSILIMLEISLEVVIRLIFQIGRAHV